MLIKLKNKIESEVAKIGNLKLDEFGIYFSEQPSYYPEGISVIDDGNGRYNLVFTERGEITSEISKLDDNEVTYQILKIIIKNISSHNIDEKDVDLIHKLIKNNEFGKVNQLVEKVQENRYRYEKELFEKISPLYTSWYEREEANRNFFRQFPEALTKGTAAVKKFRNADNVLSQNGLISFTGFYAVFNLSLLLCGVLKIISWIRRLKSS